MTTSNTVEVIECTNTKVEDIVKEYRKIFNDQKNKAMAAQSDKLWIYMPTPKQMKAEEYLENKFEREAVTFNDYLRIANKEKDNEKLAINYQHLCSKDMTGAQFFENIRNNTHTIEVETIMVYYIVFPMFIIYSV